MTTYPRQATETLDELATLAAPDQEWMSPAHRARL